MQVLLETHNTYSVCTFFARLRAAIMDGTLLSLRAELVGRMSAIPRGVSPEVNMHSNMVYDASPAALHFCQDCELHSAGCRPEGKNCRHLEDVM